MDQYTLIKTLITEARRLAEAYAEQEILCILGEKDLCLNMARNSFVAHSLITGYNRSLVERVANHVFTPWVYPN